MNTSSKPHVGLFATCLVDAMRPSIGHASIKLLEDAGCTVSIPESQTCCGQPGLNSGATDAARVLAQQLIEQFEAFDYVVQAYVNYALNNNRETCLPPSAV